MEQAAIWNTKINMSTTLTGEKTMSESIEQLIGPENYQGATRDFAHFCIEEWERKQFSSKPVDSQIFIGAVQMILDRLAPEEVE